MLDDDIRVITAWRAMLDGWGVGRRYAAVAAQAIGHIDAGFSPDAFFATNGCVSAESGFEVLQALLLRCRQASGAMVSGEFNASRPRQAENDGYVVLRKPLDLNELRGILETGLHKRRAAPHHEQRVGETAR